jgi:hypothetical protein
MLFVLLVNNVGNSIYGFTIYRFTIWGMMAKEMGPVVENGRPLDGLYAIFHTVERLTTS